MTSVSTSSSGAERDVVGRLAPSPTGKLHAGNLATFMFTWLQCRIAGGTLIMRVEDLDPPRVIEGAEEKIFADLKWLGIDWDEGPDVGGVHAPYHQSERSQLYLNALERFFDKGMVYPCDCSRSDIEAALSAPHETFDPRMRYPGTCRPTEPMERKKRMYDLLHEESDGTHDPISAWRVVCEGMMRVDDELAPPIEVDLSQVPGDFVIRRRDGLWAYQLAVSIDDIAMGVTDIVRARDLLDSTPRQFSIYETLGAELPRTWHVPLVVDADGERLSKRSKSVNRDELEEAGWTPSRFRGACARMWGWREKTEDLSTSDLLELWDPTTDELKQEEVTFVAPD